jgi:shikimate kinase
MQNIFLIGMMGSGKTTIGKALALKMNYPFFDSDSEIEAKCGTSISTIFTLEGEVGFRKRERDIINFLTQKKNVVLATGGGAILYEDNRKALQNNGIVVYLTADLESLWQRTSQDKTRPLLDNKNPKEVLKNIYEQRDPIYRKLANYTFDTSKSNISSLLNQILHCIKKNNI